MLDQAQIESIVKAKKRRVKNEEIAESQGISVRRVRQLYSMYRKSGAMPVLKKPGRPKSHAITANERAAIKEAYGKHNTISHRK